jgi:hypothetical protein
MIKAPDPALEKNIRSSAALVWGESADNKDVLIVIFGMTTMNELMGITKSTDVRGFGSAV